MHPVRGAALIRDYLWACLYFARGAFVFLFVAPSVLAASVLKFVTKRRLFIMHEISWMPDVELRCLVALN